MNLVASTFTNGALASFARRRAISVLPHARRPDHEDVLRRDFLAQRLLDLHAPPAIAQRNGDGALGGVLADDVLVQLRDDLAGSQWMTWSAPWSSSMTRLRLV